METNKPQPTRADMDQALRVLPLLLPGVERFVKRVVEAKVGATADFCTKFAALQRAKDALPSSAPPMARVDLETDMLELASDFVAAQLAKQ
jgi:hypothetical protein